MYLVRSPSELEYTRMNCFKGKRMISRQFFRMIVPDKRKNLSD